jgi:hypothetical protein
MSCKRELTDEDWDYLAWLEFWNMKDLRFWTDLMESREAA